MADGKDVSFKHNVYADIYIDILGLMAKCDTSPVHQAKTQALHNQWAKIGRLVSVAYCVNMVDGQLHF